MLTLEQTRDQLVEAHEKVKVSRLLEEDAAAMKAILSPSWELSTEHAASSYGLPVLVHRTTGETYGPADIVKPDPSSSYVLAVVAVWRLARTADLDADGRALVARFVGLAPPVA
jgi:hypothetical protein